MARVIRTVFRNQQFLWIISPVLMVVLFIILVRLVFAGVSPVESNWLEKPLGVSVSGSSTVTQGAGLEEKTLSLTGTGGGFTGTSDEGFIYYRAASPNDDIRFDVQAKLNALPTAGEAGLFIRDDDTAGAAGVFLGINSAGAAVLERRQTASSASDSFSSLVTLSVTDRLRLVGGYDAVYAYKSTDDGTTWTSLGGFPVDFVDTEQIAGVAVSGGTVDIDDLILMELPLLIEDTKDEEESIQTGTWTAGGAGAPYNGDSIVATTATASSATFDLTPLLTGTYEVYARSPLGIAGDTSLQVTNHGLDVSPPVTVNPAPDASAVNFQDVWYRVGEYWLDRETSGQQLVISNSGMAGDLSVDAIRLVKGPTAEPVIWTELTVNKMDHSYLGGVNGSRLWKTSGNGSWNADANSSRWLYADGRIQFQLNRDDKDLYVGFTDVEEDNGKNNIDYAMFFNGGGSPVWEIREDGSTNASTRVQVGPFSTSDVFAIERVGTEFRFLQNGELKYVKTAVPQIPYLVDTTFYHSVGSEPFVAIENVKIQNTLTPDDVDEDGYSDSWEAEVVANHPSVHSIFDINFGPSDDLDGDGRNNAEEYLDGTDAWDENDFYTWEDIVWTQHVNTASGVSGLQGSYLTKNTGGNTSFNADAVSDRILLGDSAVRFRFDTANTQSSYVGLTTANTGRNQSTISFSIRAQTNGTIRIYEKGSSKLNDGTTYDENDWFQILRVGDEIHYYKNAEKLGYTSILSAHADDIYENTPLIVDTSFQKLNATIIWTQYRGALFPGDHDGDNLSNEDEIFTHGTRPDLADTDGDLLDDDDELLTYLTDPLDDDSDDDGLMDGEEIAAGLNPNLKDSDLDGIEDGDEVGLGLGFLPNDPDSDGDGLMDEIELLILSHDPMDALTTQAEVLPFDDFDNDGASNIDEQDDGTDPTSGESYFLPLEWQETPATAGVANPENTRTTNLYRTDSNLGVEAIGISENPLESDGRVRFRFSDLTNSLKVGVGRPAGSGSSVPVFSHYLQMTFSPGPHIKIWADEQDTSISFPIDTLGLESEFEIELVYGANDTSKVVFRHLLSPTPVVHEAPVYDLTGPSSTPDLHVMASLDGSTAEITHCRYRNFFSLDQDDDGLTDSIEQGIIDTIAGDPVTYAHLSHFIHISQIDPNDPNDLLDGDGLTLAEELEWGTDPLLADTDDDGLSDFEEIYQSFTSPTVADSDGDLMPDGFEVEHGLKAQAYLLGVSPVDYQPDDSGEDPDMDELTNLEEYQLYLVYGTSTNPNHWDTDGDEMDDKSEHLDAVRDPTVWESLADTDSDDLPDIWEIKYFGDLITVDRDSLVGDADTLTAFQEFTQGTDPTMLDTDGDLLDDGYEFANMMDPTSADDGNEDLDLDGLTFAQELALGSDINDPDTDGDGENDGFEHHLGSDPTTSQTVADARTDWSFTLYDADLDGLPDDWEVVNGLDDPYDDEDGDGVLNVEEYRFRSDPHQTNTHSAYYTDFEHHFYVSIAPTNSYIGIGPGDIDSNGLADGFEALFWVEPREIAICAGGGSAGFYAEDCLGGGDDPPVNNWVSDSIYYITIDPNDPNNTFNPESLIYSYEYYIDDIDGDGLSNSDEYAIHTSPFDSDSDRDGVADNIDANPIYDPSFNAQNRPDSDSDTLYDRLDPDPGNAFAGSSWIGDQDDDNLPDTFEKFAPYPFLDPLVGGQDILDEDNDGLTNLQEYQLQTKLNNADTDGDGLEDGWEVAVGFDPLEPFGDADGDGMLGAWEIEQGLNPYFGGDAFSDHDDDGLTAIQEYTLGTDTDESDSDGDGIDDGDELLINTDPAVYEPGLDPNSVPVIDELTFHNPSAPADPGSTGNLPTSSHIPPESPLISISIADDPPPTIDPTILSCDTESPNYDETICESCPPIWEDGLYLYSDMIAAGVPSYLAELCGAGVGNPDPGGGPPLSLSARVLEATPRSYRKVSLTGYPMPDESPEQTDESDVPEEETYIDAFNLSLNHSTSDIYISFPGVDHDMSIKRNASSHIWSTSSGLLPHEEMDQPFGVGWNSNLCAHIKVAVPVKTKPAKYDDLRPVATVVDENGSTSSFIRSGSDWIYKPGGLVTAESYQNGLVGYGGVITLTKKFGATSTYEKVHEFRLPGDRTEIEQTSWTEYTYYRLTSVVDRNGNRLDYSYPGSETLVPSSIRDPDRNVGISISQNSDGKVTAVMDSLGYITRYEYGVSILHGQKAKIYYLKKVKRPDGSYVDYNYSTVLDDHVNADPEIHAEFYYHTDLDTLSDHRGVRLHLTYDYNRSVHFEEPIPGAEPVGNIVPRAHILQKGLPRIVTSATTPDGTARFNFNSLLKASVNMGDAPYVNFGVRNRITSVDESSREYVFRGATVYNQDLLPEEVNNPFVSRGIVAYTNMEVHHPVGVEKFTFLPAAGMALASATDLSGNITTYTYNDVYVPLTSYGRSEWGGSPFFITKFSDPTSKTRHTSQYGALTTTYTYDAVTRLMKTITDPSGVLTSYNFDGSGNRTKETVSWNGPNSKTKVTDFTYHGTYGGFMTSKTVDNDGDGPDEIMTYNPDSHGRVQWERVGPGVNGPKTSYLYDTNGNRTLVTSPRGHSMAFEYDPRGRLTTTTYPGFTHAEMGDIPVSTEVRHYDLAGKLDSITNRKGVLTNNDYDLSGRLTRSHTIISDGPDLIVEKSYYSDGRLYLEQSLRENDTVILEKEYTYDGIGRVVSSRVGEFETLYYYGENSGGSVFDHSEFKPTVLIEPRRKTITVYDDLYRPISVTVESLEAPGLGMAPVQTRTVYDEVNKTVTSYDGNGNETITKQDLNGNTYETVFADETTIQTEYAPSGRVMKVTDQRGFTTETIYNDLGQVWKSVVEIEKADAPDPAVYATTEYGYDLDGNQNSVIDPEQYESATPLAVTTLYDAFGRPGLVQMLPMIDPVTGLQVSPKVITEYDILGNVTSVTDARGNITTTTYDDASRVLTVTAPSVLVMDSVDASGAPVNWQAQSLVTTTVYADDGQIDYVLDANGNKTDNLFDKYGRLIETIDANLVKHEFTYDADGNRTGVFDGLHQTDFHYDALNRNIATEYSDGTSQVMRYDAVNLISQNNGEGTIQYSYDAMNRLKRTFGSNLLRKMAYDDAGNLETVTDVWNPEADVAYTYDGRGSMLTEESNGVTHTYTYDLNGNRSTTTYGESDRVITSVYDYHNRLGLMTESDDGGTTFRATQYEYDVAGNIVAKILPNDQVIVNHYDAVGRLSDRVCYAELPTLAEMQGAIASPSYVPVAGASAVLYHQTNGYDAAGNLLYHREDELNSTIDTLSPARTRITANTYDDTYRLEEERAFIDGVLDTKTTYAYDDQNNRTDLDRDNDGDGNIDETYDYDIDGWNRIDSFTHYKEDLENGGTEDRVVDFLYDAAGRRTDRTEVKTLTASMAQGGGVTVENKTTDYSYTVEDRLAGVEIVKDAGTPSVFSYLYDYRARRIVRDESGASAPATPEAGEIVSDTNRTSIVFSGGTSVQEYDGPTSGLGGGSSPSITKEYIRGSDYGGGIGGLLYSLDETETLSLNHFNSRGDIVAKTDAAGDFTWKADYEAFGTRPEESGTNNDRQRANTKDEDPTGLLNEHFRYRDLETGTFITRDPAGFVDGPNLYTYVRQNPWTKFDPLGLFQSRGSFLKQVGDVWKGYGTAAKNSVVGIGTMIAHPVQTGEGLIAAVSNPKQTGVAIKDSIVEAGKAIADGDNEKFGEVVGDALIGAATGGGLKFLDKAEDVASLAKKLNKIEDATDVAGDTAKVTQKASKEAADAATIAPVNPATKNRVKLRKKTKQKIEENQPRNTKGEMVDPNTNEPLVPGEIDVGHMPGQEWRKRKRMHDEKGSNRKEVLDEENNPELYQLEDRSSNRSHRYEEKG